jgi:hypothetical protein
VDDQEGHVDGVGQRPHGHARRDAAVLGGGGEPWSLVALQVGHLLGGRHRPEQPGQRPRTELRRGSLGQQPAAIAVDVDKERLESVAVDGAEDRLGRGDAHLVLG